MLTHVIFGAGAVAALFPSLPVETRFSLAIVVSLVVNLLIDELGHTMHGRFIARSPLTHSVFTAPAWGGLVGYGVWAGAGSLGFAHPGPEVAYVAAGVVVAGAHLLLDSLTERGVYLLTRRLALAHFGSGNTLLNGAFLLGRLALFVI
jgi:Protein of unknown function (DUF1286)